MILVSAFGGVYLWLFYDLSNPVSAVITLALGALCAALLLLAVVVLAGIVRLSRGPALVIGDDGLVVRTTLGSVGFIPWEQALAFIPGSGTSGQFVIVRYALQRRGRRINVYRSRMSSHKPLLHRGGCLRMLFVLFIFAV